jgi:hypothetical protein
LNTLDRPSWRTLAAKPIIEILPVVTYCEDEVA